MQAEGEFTPWRDGWGSWRGGGVGGRRRWSRGHRETSVSTNLENLTPWSLGPQGADLSDEQTKKRKWTILEAESLRSAQSKTI